MDPQPERLFEPPGRKRFCPVDHCDVPCNAITCRCKPCPSWCPFCRQRRANAPKHHFVDDLPQPSYQPRLFGAFNPPPRSKTF